MSRERMIYPEIWDSEDFMSLSLEARILWLGLITLADDHGKGKFSPKLWGKKVFHGCSKVVQSSISKYAYEISQKGMVLFHELAGHLYYYIPKWDLYQKLKYKKRSFIPDWDQKIGVKELGQIFKYENSADKEGKEGEEGKEGKECHVFAQIDWKEHQTIWNEKVAPIWGLPRINTISDTRKKHLRTRLERDPEFWDKVLEEVPRMREEVVKLNFFGFDWLVKSETNYLKLIEGSYRNNGKPGEHLAARKEQEDRELEEWLRTESFKVKPNQAPGKAK